MHPTTEKALDRLANQELRARLKEQEAVMERHEGSVVEWAKAALTIRESKLFRCDYKTFDEYCKDRWNRTRQSIEYYIRGLPDYVTTEAKNILAYSQNDKNPVNDAPAREKLDPLQRLRKIWRAKVDKLAMTRVKFNREWIQEIYKLLDRFLKGYGMLQHAEIRGPEHEKCKYCGLDVIWVTTENDKRMLLDASPGHGSFEIINGVAVSCVWDKHAAEKRYRSHFPSCTKGKKQEPIPE